MGFPIITKFIRIHHLRKMSNSNLILGSDKGKENNKTAADLEKQAICILKKKHPHSSFLLPKHSNPHYINISSSSWLHLSMKSYHLHLSYEFI
jgi:hypothetical protein